MNNSIVKLEDFELDEISGGININKEKAKQVAKKTTGYAIKGLCTAVSAIILRSICSVINSKLTNISKRLKEGDPENIDVFIACTELLSIPASGLVGWKIGELICKKIGLED